MKAIPHRAAIYIAALQFIFTLGWTVYVIYLPRLAESVGIARGAIIFILMLDQAIFTVSDFAMGVAADKMSRVVGRLGHWVAGITALSAAAFLALPFVAGSGAGATIFLALTITWAVTSSALRAPPLMLLGKYAARPQVPYLGSLALVGLGIAGAVSPYLTLVLREHDPRLPFVIASVALVLTALALSSVERRLAREAPKLEPGPSTPERKLASPLVVFGLAMVVLGLGFQLHFSMNTAAMFQRFVESIDWLMPVFWIGFSISMFPASVLAKRFGGLPVMAVSGLFGALSILIAQLASNLGLMVAAQAAAGAAWGCILMAAFTAASAIGHTGREGKALGLLFSALAIATFARMAMVAAGFGGNANIRAWLNWGPLVCWTLAGAMLLWLSLSYLRERTTR